MGGKRLKKVERACALAIETLLKNKFAILSDFTEGGFNLVIFCDF